MSDLVGNPADGLLMTQLIYQEILSLFSILNLRDVQDDLLLHSHCSVTV